MAVAIPLSGATDAAGGHVIQDERGKMLAKGILEQTGAFDLAGDKLTTSKRKTTFPMIIGDPEADLVGEGGAKPVSGLEFDATEMNVRKVATIIGFTDEMLEDADIELAGEVDRRVRRAVARRLDALAIGRRNGAAYNPAGGFDNQLTDTTQTVEYDGSDEDGLRRAISAAMGTLEGNGYDDEGQMGLLLASDVKRHTRDARRASDSTDELYKDSDPFYGLDPSFSTNLNKIGETAGAGKVIGIVAYKPNVHVRIRHDIRVKPSTDAVVNDGVGDRNAYQEDLTFLRFVTRQAFMVHDLNRAVVKILNAS